VITGAWVDAPDEFVYESTATEVKLRARATAIHAIPSILVYTLIEGSCTKVSAPERIGGTGSRDIRFSVTLAVTDPGDKPGRCWIRLGLQVDAAVRGQSDEHAFTVRRE
jgi:hypothetical protein